MTIAQINARLLTIRVAAVLAAIATASAFLLLQSISTQAVGKPTHSHEGYELLSGGECNSTASHFEDEMNWLADNLPGFTDTGTYGPWYPNDPDNCYNGSTQEDNSAREFQNWAGIQVDGDTGNQTWTYMELWVRQAPGRAIDASPHAAGTKVRYPIFNECRAITNNNSVSIASPLKTDAEWESFKANAPNITNAAGNCNISGSSGSGGGDGGSSYNCNILCQDWVCGSDSCPNDGPAPNWGTCNSGTSCKTVNCAC